jgi:8-oxo-dGTP pyrophosphatase MutT (NUDIX family)
MLDFETPEAAVRREAREECGLAIVTGVWRRAAIDHVTALHEETHFEKHNTFCDATARGSAGEPMESDHRLTWVSPEEAQRLLTPASHRWAVAEWLAAGPA